MGGIKTSYYKRLRRKNDIKRFFRRNSGVKKLALSAFILATFVGICFVGWMLVDGYLPSSSSEDADRNHVEVGEEIGNDTDNYESDSIEEGNENKDNTEQQVSNNIEIFSESIVTLNPEQIPEYSGEDHISLNGNKPMFNQYDLENIEGEHYSEFDSLGRCGVAYAMLDKSMMPTEERTGIGMIKPSGWHTVKYPDVVEGLYLYNRCHLIGYALAGENANELNLITGTRYFNVSIMLIFEREVIRVLEDTNYHVLYRVTPYFRDEELVARGVEMEAYSVEDNGESLCFHVFCYNIQPGIGIDYSTGDSWVQ